MCLAINLLSIRYFEMSFTISLLKFICFVDLLAVGLIVPLLPAHIRQMGGSHIAVGALGSVYSGFQLCSGPVVGSLSDLKGRKNILILSLVMSGAAYAVTGFTSAVTVIILMRAVLGVFKQTQMLTRAMVPDYEKRPNVQSEIYGKMAAISGMGITVGPVIGGHIADDYSNGLMIIGVVVAVCFFINAVLTMFLPNVENARRANRATEHEVSESLLNSIGSSLKQSVMELLNIEWSKYWDIFMLKVFIGFAMSVYYSNYSLYLSSRFELTRKQIGYIISFQGIVGSISCYFIGFINSLYCNDDAYVRRQFHVFVLICGSFLGLLLSFSVYTYIFWLTPLAIGNAIGRLVGLEMLLNRGHNTHRGTLIGSSNSVRSLTGVVAPMVAGYVSHYIGLSYVIYASFLSALIGLVISFRSFQNKIQIKED